jgi:hypothetical protein
MPIRLIITFFACIVTVELANAQTVDCQALKNDLSSPRVLNGSPKLLEMMTNEYHRPCSDSAIAEKTSVAPDQNSAAREVSHDDLKMLMRGRLARRL